MKVWRVVRAQLGPLGTSLLIVDPRKQKREHSLTFVLFKYRGLSLPKHALYVFVHLQGPWLLSRDLW